MSNAYDYQEDPELSGKFVTMGEGAAVDRYDEPTARIVVRPPSVVRLPEQEDTRMSDALVRMGAIGEEPDRVIAPESYKPAPAWATGLVEGARDYIKRPGQTMTPNPHDPASEEWQAYEDFRNQNAVNFGGETALNAMGTGGLVGVPARAGEVVLAAGAGRKAAPKAAPKMGSTAQFPQYAEVYPEVGPPIDKWDPVKKKKFPGKNPTPDAVAFMKARAKISADMEKNGYTPYFDPAKRFDVDPKNYPPNVDTLTVTPAKQATIDEHMKTIDTEEGRARLRAAYQRGTELPETDRWYWLGQHRYQYGGDDWRRGPN
jgi:hypothetical protein